MMLTDSCSSQVKLVFIVIFTVQLTTYSAVDTSSNRVNTALGHTVFKQQIAATGLEKNLKYIINGVCLVWQLGSKICGRIVCVCQVIRRKNTLQFRVCVYV